MTFDEILELSPFPLVDLAAPTPPHDGFFVPAPHECRKNFSPDGRCRGHYETLKNSGGAPVQCPFGFASLAIPELNAAFSGVIPFPRLGGDTERIRAKRYPNHKVSVDALDRAAHGLRLGQRQIQEAERDAVLKQSVALHEIRKLNRTVKHTAERLCEKESPHDIDGASPELVRILKTSELMSSQFDVLELLANEGLASLPLKTKSDVYRMFDKCVRIYQPEGPKRRIRIWEPSGFNPSVRVCDKTFPIIPTVLIENAIKYSLPDSEISVELRPDGDAHCLVSVSSISRGDVHLTSEIFARGVRGNVEVEGSGNGLYLAELIARQHNTTINLQTEPWSAGRQRVRFTLRLALDRP